MDEPIEVPQELFLKHDVMVCRAVVMLGRVRENASTCTDVAQEIHDLAYGHRQRVHELFGHLATWINAKLSPRRWAGRRQAN